MNINDFFELHNSVAVAFSGGVDSSVLLLLAKRYAEKVKAYYVKSDFQPGFEYNDAVETAKHLGVEMKTLTVDILSNDDVAKNPSDRCYYCKKHIFKTVISAAHSDGFECVVEGTNASDDISDRPGFRALGELGVLSPLRDCGLSKKEIRKIAAENGLSVAGKPSYACLATRIPTGTPITKQLLEKTEKAEGWLREIGFRNFRVRYAGGAARLELGRCEAELYNENKGKIDAILSSYYEGIYLDPREREDE